MRSCIRDRSKGTASAVPFFAKARYNQNMKMLPQNFLLRMERKLGAGYPAFLASYDGPPVRGVRINTLKTDAASFQAVSPWPLEPGGIAPDSFVIASPAEGIGNHPYHAAGLIYVQEPSAALPTAMADIRPGMRVLDLCAAPGGKSGAAAAALAGRGLLVANELVPARAKVLEATLERMGAVNAAVTNARPSAVADAFEGYFDVVLIDAPCSGEGMFRKDAGAAAQWSEAHVASCAARQRLILGDAARCTAPNGVIVYSTCTFSDEENEQNVAWFIEAHPEFMLEDMRRLYPHTCRGEGHFAARMRKMDGVRAEQDPLRLRPCMETAYNAFMQDTFETSPAGEAFLLPDGRVTLMREALPEGLGRLRVLASGVMAGETVKGRMEPSHALFMAAHGGAYRRMVELGEGGPQALCAFMAGETVPCLEELHGYCAVAYRGYTLGFGKADHGTLKNHLPKGLRIAKISPSALT